MKPKKPLKPVREYYFEEDRLGTYPFDYANAQVDRMGVKRNYFLYILTDTHDEHLYIGVAADSISLFETEKWAPTAERHKKYNCIVHFKRFHSEEEALAEATELRAKTHEQLRQFVTSVNSFWINLRHVVAGKPTPKFIIIPESMQGKDEY
jgi:predicted GIY-YIG superfamily endonuclease